MNKRGDRILAAMDSVAEELDAKLSQIAVAWLLHQPLVTAPIASATNEKQLDELVGASTLKLTQVQLNKLEEASAY